MLLCGPVRPRRTSERARPTTPRGTLRQRHPPTKQKKTRNIFNALDQREEQPTLHPLSPSLSESQTAKKRTGKERLREKEGTIFMIIFIIYFILFLKKIIWPQLVPSGHQSMPELQNRNWCQGPPGLWRWLSAQHRKRGSVKRGSH